MTGISRPDLISSLMVSSRPAIHDESRSGSLSASRRSAVQASSLIRVIPARASLQAAESSMAGS